MHPEVSRNEMFWCLQLAYLETHQRNGLMDGLSWVVVEIYGKANIAKCYLFTIQFFHFSVWQFSYIGPNVTRKANLSEMEDCISDTCYLKFFSESAGQRWDLKLYTSNKRPGDVHAAGWGEHTLRTIGLKTGNLLPHPIRNLEQWLSSLAV